MAMAPCTSAGVLAADAEALAFNPPQRPSAPTSLQPAVPDSAPISLKAAVPDWTKPYEAEPLCEVSTALPSEDDSEVDALVAMEVNEAMELAQGKEASKLLGAAICRNASFLENLPAMNEAHKSQLLKCGLSPEDFQLRDAALQAINDEIARVTGEGVEVYKQTLSMISSRRKDLRVLQAFKRKAARASDDELPALARQAVEKLKTSQVQSAELMPALNNFRAAASKLQKMCEDESVAQQAIISKKEEQAAALKEEMEAKEATLKAMRDSSGRAEAELAEAEKMARDMEEYLRDLRERLNAQLKEKADWYSAAGTACKAGVLAAGTVAIGCAAVTGCALIALGPWSIAAMVVGAAVGAAAVAGCAAVAVTAAAVAGLCDEEVERQKELDKVQLRAAELANAASSDEFRRKKEEYQRQEAEFNTFQEELRRIGERKEMLEEHKKTLSGMQKSVDDMVKTLKETGNHSNEVLGFLHFFDTEAAAAIEAAEEDDEDELAIYLTDELTETKLSQWKENIDCLETANHRLMQAVHALNKPKD